MKKPAICRMMPYGEARDRQPPNYPLYSRAPTPAVAPLDNPKITLRIREPQTPHRQLRNGPITVRMTGTLRGLYDGVITGYIRELHGSLPHVKYLSCFIYFNGANWRLFRRTPLIEGRQLRRHHGPLRGVEGLKAGEFSRQPRRPKI